MDLPSDAEAKRLVRSGLFYVCATCSKWHEGMALGKDTCAGVACGSPVRRKDYPEYFGKIKDFSALCFVCGSEEVLAFAKVEGSDRQFGLCREHLEIVDDYIGRGPNGLASGGDKKVFIFPNPDRAMAQFRDSRVTL